MSDLSYVRNNDGSYSKLVQLSGSKVAISTVLNAQTVVAGGDTGEIDLGVQGNELDVYLVINIDQQPWTLSASNNFSLTTIGGSYKQQSVYPTYSGHTSTFSNTHGGAVALMLGLSAYVSGVTLSNMADARNFKVPLVTGQKAKITNSSASPATVTIRVVRVLR